MPELFIYLFKINTALVLFCLGYYLVLRKLTFYTLNRVYLVAAIIFSTAYPWINFSDFIQRHQQISRPVEQVVLIWKAPAENFVKPLAQPDYWQWAVVIFWLGVILFTVRLLIQIVSLVKLYRSSTPANINNYDVRVIDTDAGPFSFWQSIFINPKNHQPAELNAILEHEQVHVDDWHIFDILLAELSTVFYWFNPGVWLMKKAVKENIEFITDRKILQKGIDSKAYQYSLLTVSLSTNPHTIVNNFNISTIKKRIIMMNAKRSSRYNLTRYVFIVPAVLLLLAVFSFSKAAVIKKSSKKALDHLTTVIADAKDAVINETASTIPVGLTAVYKTTLKSAASAKPIAKKPDTLTLGTPKLTKTDTGKKGSVTIYTNNSFASDSMNYVINGKKASKAEFKKLDSKDIMSINLVSAENAAKVIEKFNNDWKVLFVTTDNSEEGKKMLAKLNKVNNTHGYVVGEGNIAVVNAIDAKQMAELTKSVKVNVASLVDNYTVAAVANAKAVTVNVKPMVTTTVKPLVLGKIYVSNDSTYVIKGSNKIKIANGKDTKVYAIKAGKPNKVYKLAPMKSDLKMLATPGEVLVISDNKADPVVTSTNFSDKLIMIDDKQASQTDLKKLSAFDIDRMTFRNDDDTRSQYGDKAKNGVVYIYTKKANK